MTHEGRDTVRRDSVRVVLVAAIILAVLGVLGLITAQASVKERAGQTVTGV